MVEWQKTQLSNVLKISNILSTLPNKNKRIKVKLNLKGVEKRAVSEMEDEGATTYYVRSGGQFIYGKQNLHKGAFGIIPEELDGYESSQDLPSFDIKYEEMFGEWLVYYLRNGNYYMHLIEKAKGTGSKRIHEDIFLLEEIPLPNKDVQKAIINKVQLLEHKIKELKNINYSYINTLQQLTFSIYDKYIENCKWDILKNVAPIVRRSVKIENDTEYHELGLRSFGKGTFHKPAIKGSDVGTKRLFEIHPDDLLFSNIFSWEGAIAVAKPEDKGYVGSHRYITCQVDQEIANPHFLCYFFLSPIGQEEILKASPGSAGRNKTLGLTKLEQIKVPIPNIQLQNNHHLLQTKIKELEYEIKLLEQFLDDLIPSILDKAFKGDYL